MRISEGVEWGLHCLVLLATVPPERALAAAKLAEFHDVPPAYLAKHLQALSRAGLVDTVPGPRGGYRLARPAAEITVLDVLAAIDGPAPAFSCTEIRRRGPAGLPDRYYRSVCGVHRAMLRAEEAYRAALRETTVADLVQSMLTDAAPEGLRRGAQWLQDALS
ncbi:MAG TPA: Rrf2 family transcriptional regulator [Acidimicrobiales bacterium]|jgi:Rrf2 family protein|nr:Rrf2 family transcriptional regulator [Acidimicrobiales bacterium]